MPLIISHRANLAGPDPTRDNEPQSVQQCLQLGLDVVIDVWHVSEEHIQIGQGHGCCDVDFKLVRNPHVWCRAHSLEVMLGLRMQKAKHYFLTAAGPTLTSCQHFWTEEKILAQDKVAFEAVAANTVLQCLDVAQHSETIELCRPYYAICSDHPLDWQRKLR